MIATAMKADDTYCRNRDSDDKQEFVDLGNASERPENGGDEGIRTLYIPTSSHSNIRSPFFNKNF